MPEEPAKCAGEEYDLFTTLVDLLLSVSRRELQDLPEVGAEPQDL
jgi:hypothetical protein